MAITRIDHNQRWENGELVDDEVVEVDITGPVVRLDLHSKARQSLAANSVFLAIPNPTAAQSAAQVKTLTRQVNGIIRLLLATDGAPDLLVEDVDT